MYTDILAEFKEEIKEEALVKKSTQSKLKTRSAAIQIDLNE